MSSSLKRSSSLGRLSGTEDPLDDYRYKMAIEKLRCDLVGFPYCCNRHYSTYRRPPYYTDLDYPYYRWYDRTYWPDWPYYGRRPWWYYDDGYYRDYIRGYEEGLKKYDSKLRRSTSSADLAAPDKFESSSRAAAAENSAAASSARPLASRTQTPPPPPPPLPSYYYDRYYYPPYWNSYYYYRPPYYWRRYLDSRAY
uniref:Uncharacterized protein n=2 Tax=Macrostomum lignano TaxID=282301 RepID=A0A1I8G0B6_9PLAT